MKTRQGHYKNEKLQANLMNKDIKILNILLKNQIQYVYNNGKIFHDEAELITKMQGQFNIRHYLNNTLLVN